MSEEQDLQQDRLQQDRKLVVSFCASVGVIFTTVCSVFAYLAWERADHVEVKRLLLYTAVVATASFGSCLLVNSAFKRRAQKPKRF